MDDAPAADQLTEGGLLGGRLRYSQPMLGYRTGIEPILLAAAIPARAGEHVVEGGTGAGAGVLALSARVAGVSCTGIELDPGLAALAARNLAANGFTMATIRSQDVTTWRDEKRYDHAMANPPWHEAAGTPSPSPGRRLAKQASAGVLNAWCLALGRCLRPRGSLTLIVPAAHLTASLSALSAARCAEISIYPLWPRHGVAAKLVILRAIHQGRGPTRLLAGLVLHQANGAYTSAAEALLRDGACLEF